MSPRHRNEGQHLPRQEAALLAAVIRGEHDAARRRRRSVIWDSQRPVPVAVSDEWPLEVPSV